MEKGLSEKIRIASLLCTFMVIVRHARNLHAFWGTESVTGVCAFVENGFSVLTEIAVPYFFMVSGFFFFRTNYYQEGAYVVMLQKKARTLLVPFLIWNVTWGAILYAIGFMDWGEPLADKVTHLLMSDYYGALWYVRTLMLLMVLVPLYGWLFTTGKRWLLVLAGAGLFVLWFPVDCALLSTEGLFFFFLGGVLQRYQGVVNKKAPWGVLAVMLAVWCGMCFLRLSWSINMNKLNTLWGICTFWMLLDYLGNAVKRALLSASAMTFFIYVNHFWVVKGMKVMLAQQYQQSEMVALLAYFLLPIITFFCLLWVGWLWKRFAFRSYDVATGGR